MAQNFDADFVPSNLKSKLKKIAVQIAPSGSNLESNVSTKA